MGRYNENEKFFKVGERDTFLCKKIVICSYVQFTEVRKSSVLKNEKYYGIICHFEQNQFPVTFCEEVFVKHCFC